MAKKTVGQTRKKTPERVSDREDGRLATLMYLDATLLAEVQAAAKARHQPTWLLVEEILSRAMKSRRGK